MRSTFWFVAALALSSILASVPSVQQPQTKPCSQMPLCVLADPQRELDEARLQAGRVALQGPGVVVTLNDSPRARPIAADPYFYTVHDVDLQALVNELWAAGAEAVSINEERVLNRTSIRCAGRAIRVNEVRLSPPYVVKAICPPDLAKALAIPGGFDDSMKPLLQHGGSLNTAYVDQIRIPAYTGSLGFRYARPVRP